MTNVVISLDLCTVLDSSSKKILAAAGVSEDIRARDPTPDQEDAIRRSWRNQSWRRPRREVNLNIKRLMEIGSYRGVRHRRGLPAVDKH